MIYIFYTVLINLYIPISMPYSKEISTTFSIFHTHIVHGKNCLPKYATYVAIDRNSMTHVRQHAHLPGANNEKQGVVGNSIIIEEKCQSISELFVLNFCIF